MNSLQIGNYSEPVFKHEYIQFILVVGLLSGNAYDLTVVRFWYGQFFMPF